MRVILSKKGFDGKFGGIASPIMPDGTLLSLPIPTEQKKFGVNYSDLKYGDITYDRVIRQLNKKKESLCNKCHLDPDIREDETKRKTGWKPLFGQTSNPLSRLKNVKEGDLFLFFGWFRETEGKVAETLKYKKGEYENKHIIFGYLQIGKIYTADVILQDFPEELQYHPHYQNRMFDEYKHNCIFEGSENLFDTSLPGAGCFNYNPKLVLTKEVPYTKTQWKLPSFFKEQIIKISGIKDPYKDDYFQAPKTFGQEFVIEENKDVENWAKELVKNNAIINNK